MIDTNFKQDESTKHSYFFTPAFSSEINAVMTVKVEKIPRE